MPITGGCEYRYDVQTKFQSSCGSNAVVAHLSTSPYSGRVMAWYACSAHVEPLRKQLETTGFLPMFEKEREYA